MVKYTKVIINGITIKDDSSGSDPKKIFSWEYTKDDDDEINDMTITCPSSVFDLVEVTNGMNVQVFKSNDNSTYTRIFYGDVDDIKPDGSTYEFLCKNEMMDLIRKNVNKIYDYTIDASAGVKSAIASDLITTYGGLTANVQNSGTVDILEEFKCIQTNIFERVKVLRDSLNWTLWYNDITREVHFEPNGFEDSGVTLTTSSNIIGVPSWEFDKSSMINDLTIEGATVQTTLTESGQIGVTSGYTNESILLTRTPDSSEVLLDSANPPITQLLGGSKDASTGNDYYIDKENKKIVSTSTFPTSDYAIVNYQWSAPAPVRMTNDSSIATYGSYEETVELTDVSSVADAESRGTTILEKQSIPFITGTLLIKSNIDLKVGQLVTVQDNITRDNVSGTYVVKTINYKYPSGSTEITVGDKEWRLGDWQELTDNRLKRIEEEFIRNQDILTNLVNIQNTPLTNFKRHYPRYRKVLKQDYNVTNNIMIWDNADHGTWGTQKWGTDSEAFDAEEDYFTQQYQDTYEEDFIDEDFKSTNTTATWSTTGSVTFTSGQIAESTSIDYDNSTITTAKLTSTETSGTFTYELTADGTNWETVTSGTAHTFTNTGTDLRWRATESAASIGEISQIKIESYH